MLTAATLGMLALANPAAAHQIRPYEFLKSFNGGDSTAGAMTSNVVGITVNQGNGNLYVLDEHSGHGTVSQFNANGEAQNFIALGASSFELPTVLFNPDILFDNSGHGGGLWVDYYFRNLRAYNEDGTVRLSEPGEIGGGCGIGIDPEGFVYVAYVNSAGRYNPDTGIEDQRGYFSEQEACHITFDTNGYAYTNKYGGHWDEGGPGLYKYYKGKENITCCEGVQGFNDRESLQVSHVNTRMTAVDPSSNDIYAIQNENEVAQYSPGGQPITTFGSAEGAFTGLAGARGITVNKNTHNVYVTSTGPTPRINVFHQGAPITVPDATTEPAGHPSTTSAILKGVINADGVATTECKFEWGPSTTPESHPTKLYENGSVPCAEGNVFSGSTDQPVTHEVTSLTKGTKYHYRVAAKNANGAWSYGVDHTFEASVAPGVTPLIVDRVNTDGARFSSEVNPNGGITHYRFEVGPEDCASNPCTPLPVPDGELASNLEEEHVMQAISGLHPDTAYHVRIVAENGAGEDELSYVFRTYPSPPTSDPCANAHVRQQTSASLLPDCRAYELVSAANAGGYDVESDLVPEQAPFTAYPYAEGRVLYGLHFGSIPYIAGSPPNYGLDPYVATRGENGWNTEYVGLPAGGMADQNPFGSPLLGADQGLRSFAFGGPGICKPCFAGAGTNLPLRLNGGAPIEGMVGDLNPGEPAPGEPAPTGYVAKYLSADGSHLVFGSTKKFEPAGVEGALTIYQRDLINGKTQVVSTNDVGATLSGPNVAELDQSSDGSRVVIGSQGSPDAAGNMHYHLYMHIGTSPDSADLKAGNNALFDGMTADGSKVFFTTTDKLLATDTDESADIYEAEVSPAGAVTLHLVSVNANGSASNDDTCTPPGSPSSWNSVSGEGKCNAVAFAGGAGVASGDGTFYFVSPEQLDGSKGVQDQANLYIVKPGSTPKFVVTMDSSLAKPPPKPLAYGGHPVANANFTGGSLSGPEGLAVDQSNGDVYAIETTAGKVARVTSAGAAHNFSAAQPYIEGNKITGLNVPSNSASALAVDNSGSPLNGDLYVTNSPKISIFAPSGEKLGELNGEGEFAGAFIQPCGVAVDQSNGAVYIGDKAGAIWRYLPKPAASAPFDDSDFTTSAVITSEFNPCEVAADSAGHVYAAKNADGPVKKFDASSFESPYSIQSGALLDENGKAMATDPVTNDLYVQEGNEISVFNSSGEHEVTFTGASMSASRGVAVNETSHHVFAPSASLIIDFGWTAPPYTPIDNPAVVHGVQQAGTHSTADFQVTPDGRYAVFGSSLSLTGFMNLGNSEIYRYDSQEEELDCASCTTTGAAAKTDTSLAPNGLNISEDGRVFFTSDEALVLSDTNERKDAYEWSGGTAIGRISTGVGNTDSSLMSVSENGVDAFFFTRQVLVPSDENGGAVKIYDAREGGGYPYSPPRPLCAASDECHGPGTQAPPPPNINSIEPAGVPRVPSPPSKKCRKGFVKRHGKCVRRHRKPRRRPNAHGRRNHG